jgi:hypothetical protein
MILLSWARYTELISIAARGFVSVIKAFEVEFIGIAACCCPAQLGTTNNAFRLLVVV